MSNSSIWPIDRILSGATTPGQSRPGSDGKLEGWSLTIRLFSVINRTIVGWEVLPLRRNAVGVFYSPSWQGCVILRLRFSFQIKDLRRIIPNSLYLCLFQSMLFSVNWCISGTWRKLLEKKTRWRDYNEFIEKGKVRHMVTEKNIPVTLFVCFSFPQPQPQKQRDMKWYFLSRWKRTVLSHKSQPLPPNGRGDGLAYNEI